MHTAETIRQSLLSPEKGFFVLKGFYSLEEVKDYREYCQSFMAKGARIHTRINTDSMRDYVHPRSHDSVDRTSRIYQFFHNHQHDKIGAFLNKAISLRDQIEYAWESYPLYASEKRRLQDYTIVTAYKEKVGMLPIHRDYCGPAPFPLIQFWVLLSTPGVDYNAGNLVLHPTEGTPIRVEADLGMQPGDALVFDKSLLHEVEETLPGSDIGRWTVLIGARAERDSRLKSMYKQIRYANTTDALAGKVKKILRQH